MRLKPVHRTAADPGERLLDSAARSANRDLATSRHSQSIEE